MHNTLQNLYFTYRVHSYTYSMTYSSGLVIIIQEKGLLMSKVGTSWTPG